MLLEEAGYVKKKHDSMVEEVKTHHGDIVQVIEHLRLGYCRLYGFTRFTEINGGMCEDFAHDVKAIISSAEPIWDDQLESYFSLSHCLILYHGRYYDAECPRGADDWKQLPYYQPDSGKRNQGPS